MTTSSLGARQRIVLTHAVLVGLTPLIPVPYVDDLVKSYFQRRMVRSLAAAHGQPLSPAAVERLADDPDSCLGGCLYTLVIYPLRWLARKIVFILEWRRAINLVSHSYYRGYLLDHALERGWLAPGTVAAAAQLRVAMDRTRAGSNTRLLSRAVGATFGHSRRLVWQAGRQLVARLGDLARRARIRRAAPAAEAAVEGEPVAEAAPVQGLIERLQAAIAMLPAEHFADLEARLAAELAAVRAAAAAAAAEAAAAAASSEVPEGGTPEDRAPGAGGAPGG
jgi:hypothetical protein